MNTSTTVAELADDAMELLDRLVERYGELRDRLGDEEIWATLEKLNADEFADAPPVVALVHALEQALKRRRNDENKSRESTP